MGRPRQPEIAGRLLSACVDYSLEHGLPDGLDPLARAANTSVRMLVYHFGSKDELFLSILRSARQRQLQLFGALLTVQPGERYTVTLQRAWTVMMKGQGQPYLRMFSRLRDDTEQQLWPGFRREATTDWLALLETGLRSMGRAGFATLTLSVIRGLMMDLDATGDTDRVDQAFDAFLVTLDTDRNRA
jgi:AcrR family transcriptional regulator